MRSWEWSDVRCFLAVARHGATLRAAKELGMNQTTCARRVAALETQVQALKAAQVQSDTQGGLEAQLSAQNCANDLTRALETLAHPGRRRGGGRPRRARGPCRG